MLKARFTQGVGRSQLAKQCFDEVRMWPGCETIMGVAVLRDGADRFQVKVTAYGAASKRLADRAIGCVEREKLRYYHLIDE